MARVRGWFALRVPSSPEVAAEPGTVATLVSSGICHLPARTFRETSLALHISYRLGLPRPGEQAWRAEPAPLPWALARAGQTEAGAGRRKGPEEARRTVCLVNGGCSPRGKAPGPTRFPLWFSEALPQRGGMKRAISALHPRQRGCHLPVFGLKRAAPWTPRGTCTHCHTGALSTGCPPRAWAASAGLGSRGACAVAGVAPICHGPGRAPRTSGPRAPPAPPH